jgi:hypothetical protein
VSIIYNTAADIIIKGFDPRTKRLPKTPQKKLYRKDHFTVSKAFFKI